MKRCTWGPLLASIATLFAAAGAAAAPVTLSFSGTFSLVQGAAPAGLAGSTFYGTVVYDPAATVAAGTANTLTYAFGSASLGAQTVLGSGASLAGSGNFGQSWDASVPTRLHGTLNPADQFGAGANAAFDAGLAMFTGMSLQLVDDQASPDDPFGTALSSPPTAFALGDFEAAEFSLIGLTSTPAGGFLLSALAVGSLDCLSTTAGGCARPVPTPGTLSLLVAGLAAGALRRRRSG